MPSQNIVSSFIKSISHANDALTVEFKKGSKRFRYNNVPMKEYVKMCVSKEPGKYYMENIKGKYKSVELQKYQA